MSLGLGLGILVYQISGRQCRDTFSLRPNRPEYKQLEPAADSGLAVNSLCFLLLCDPTDQSKSTNWLPVQTYRPLKAKEPL